MNSQYNNKKKKKFGQFTKTSSSPKTSTHNSYTKDEGKKNTSSHSLKILFFFCDHVWSLKYLPCFTVSSFAFNSANHVTAADDVSIIFATVTTTYSKSLEDFSKT